MELGHNRSGFVLRYGRPEVADGDGVRVCTDAALFASTRFAGNHHVSREPARGVPFGRRGICTEARVHDADCAGGGEQCLGVGIVYRQRWPSRPSLR